MKNYLFILLLAFSPALLHSADVTVISGKIDGAGNDTVSLSINRDYLNQKPTIYKTLAKDNAFRFEFSLDRNRLVELMYQSQMIRIYAEQGDDIEVKFKAGSLSESIEFAGKNSANNIFNKKFNEQFKNDFSTKDMEDKMKTIGVDQFEMLLFDNRGKEKKFYDSYSDKASLSDKFKKYIENLIKYNYLNNLFAFPIVNANKSTAILTVSQLPSVMTEGFDKTKVSDDEAMISESYRNFLTYFVTYFTSELNGFNKFKDYNVSAEKKYVIAKENLHGEPFTFYFTNFLLENGEKVNPDVVQRMYDEIVTQDKAKIYAILVKEKLGKWMKTKLPKTKEGKLDIASPDYKLIGLDGKEVSLADYRGKVVYVDFWASWCGPCRGQMPYSKELHAKLSDKQKKQVVFLYISIDNTEDVWKKAIKDLGMEGEHALSPGGWNSTVAKYYQIQSIPRYLLVNKKGEVVNADAPRPSTDEILQDILDLLK